ncbi:MAG: class I SAM-dependent methyltransferase [Weeksellaceae bacterium]
MKIQNLTLPLLTDYQLLDAGHEEKLETIAGYTVIRGEPQAIWHPYLPQSEWQKASATHLAGQRNDAWRIKQQSPANWKFRWNELTFLLRLTQFKHVGVFPENAIHWEWMQTKIKAANRPINVLNLFAYTGGGTLAALSAGASVTHVDASKGTVTWARENAEASKLADKPVRWIVDDVLTYVRREIKRGKKYDGIIIDPPKFGHGSSGQLWKFEQDFAKLLQMCQELLSEQPLFVLVNAYAVPYSPVTVGQVVQQQLKLDSTVECGEVFIPFGSEKNLAIAMYARWANNAIG